jgi:hypothetical protein
MCSPWYGLDALSQRLAPFFGPVRPAVRLLRIGAHPLLRKTSPAVSMSRRPSRPACAMMRTDDRFRRASDRGGRRPLEPSRNPPPAAEPEACGHNAVRTDETVRTEEAVQTQEAVRTNQRTDRRRRSDRDLPPCEHPDRTLPGQPPAAGHRHIQARRPRPPAGVTPTTPRLRARPDRRLRRPPNRRRTPLLRNPRRRRAGRTRTHPSPPPSPLPPRPPPRSLKLPASSARRAAHRSSRRRAHRSRDEATTCIPTIGTGTAGSLLSEWWPAGSRPEQATPAQPNL